MDSTKHNNANATNVGHVTSISPTDICSTQQKADGTSAISFKPHQNLDEILSIPSRIGIIQWTDSQSAGVRLASYPVSPLYCDQFIQASTTVGRTTNLAHFAASAQFWRGAINFSVETIATRFQNGKLYVVYTPGVKVPTLAEARALGGAVIDLGVRNSVKLEVPYNSPSDYLHTYAYSTTFDKGFLPTSPPYNLDYTHGMVSIFVLNALIPASSSSVSGTVDVNTYISAGKGFELAMPGSIPKTFAFQDSNIFYINPGVAIISNAPAEPQPVAGEMFVRLRDYEKARQVVRKAAQDKNVEVSEEDVNRMALNFWRTFCITQTHSMSLQSDDKVEKSDTHEREKGNTETFASKPMPKVHKTTTNVSGQEAELCNIAKAETISQRVSSFGTSDSENTIVDSFSLLDLIEDVNAPLHGITSHYEIISADVDVIIRCPSTPHHQGLLIAYAEVVDNGLTPTVWSCFNNFPHAKLNVNDTTEMVLTVPYLRRTRVGRALPNTLVKLYVANRLRGGTDVPVSLPISYAWRLTNHRFNTRKVVTQGGNLQDPTDTTLEKQTTQDIVEEQTVVSRSYMKAMDFQDFMHRSGLHDIQNVDFTTNKVYEATVPHVLSPDVLRLAQIFMLQTGALEHTVHVPGGAGVAGGRAFFNSFLAFQNTVNSGIGVDTYRVVTSYADSYQEDSYVNNAVWNNVIDNNFTFRAPYFSQTPLNVTNLRVGGSELPNGSSEIPRPISWNLFANSEATGNVLCTTYTRAAEDFQFFVLQAPPALVYSETGWQPETTNDPVDMTDLLRVYRRVAHPTRESTSDVRLPCYWDFPEPSDASNEPAVVEDVIAPLSEMLVDAEVPLDPEITPHGSMGSFVETQGGCLSVQTEGKKLTISCTSDCHTKIDVVDASEDEEGEPPIELPDEIPTTSVETQAGVSFPRGVKRKGKTPRTVLNEAIQRLFEAGCKPKLTITKVNGQADTLRVSMDYHKEGDKRTCTTVGIGFTKQMAVHDASERVLAQLVADDVICYDDDDLDGGTGSGYSEALHYVHSFLGKKKIHTQAGGSFFSAFFDYLKTALASGIGAFFTVFDFLRQTPAKIIDSIAQRAGVQFYQGAVSQAREDAVEILEWILKLLKGFFAIIWLTSKITSYIQGGQTLIALLGDFLMLFSSDCCSDLVGVVKDLIARIPFLQSDENNELISGIISIATTMLVGTAGANLNRFRFTSERYVLAKLAGETTKDIYQLIKKAVNAVVEYFFEGEPSMDRADLAKILEDADAASELFYDYRAHGYFTNKMPSQAVLDIYNPVTLLVKCRNIAIIIKKCSVGKTVPHGMLKFAEDALSEWDRFRKSDAASTMRGEPVGVLLTGGAGCGKSFLSTTILPDVVLSKIGIIEDRADTARMVYNMPNDPNHAYMDNYWGQPWAVYDDLGATKDGPELARMINLISTATSPVNMASLEDKGQMFISPFVCATTNLDDFQPANNIRYVDAICRRFPHAYKVDVKDEYQLNGRLDMAKFAAAYELITDEETEAALLDAVFTFTQRDMSSGRNGNVVDFATLTNAIAREHLSHSVTSVGINKIRQSIKIKSLQSQVRVQAGDDDEDYQDSYQDTADAATDQTPPVQVTPDLSSLFGASDRDRGNVLYQTLGTALLRGNAEALKDALEEAIQDMPAHIDHRIDNTAAVDILNECFKVVDTWDFKSWRHILLAIRKLEQVDEWTVACFILCAYARVHGRFTFFEGNFFWGYSCAFADGMNNPGEHKVYIAARQMKFYDEKCKDILDCWNKRHKRDDDENNKWTGLRVCWYSKVFMRAVFGKIATAIVVAVSIRALYKLIKLLLNYMFSGFEVQHYEHDARKVVPRKFVPTKVTTQASVNPKLQKAVVKIRTQDQNLGHGIMYDDRYVLMPYHFLTVILKVGGLYCMTYPTLNEGKPVEMWYSLEFYHQISVADRMTDCVMVRLPTAVPGVRKIDGLLCTNQELNNYLMGLHRDVTLRYDVNGGEPLPAVVEGTSLVADGLPTEKTIFIMCRVPSGTTRKGDCGLPYTTNSDKILGFHVNKEDYSNRVGFAMLSKQLCHNARTQIEKVAGETIHIEHDPEIVKTEKPEHWEVQDAGFEHVGNMKAVDGKNIVSYCPGKTKFRRSLIADTEAWPDDHAPAQQRSSILNKVCQKFHYDRSTLAVTEEESQFVLSYFKNVFDLFPDRDTSVLSDDEVLNGDGCGNVAMKRDTSAGIWNYISKQKKDLIDVEYVGVEGKAHYSFSEIADMKEHPLYGETFLHQYNKRLEDAKKGVRIQKSPWIVCLKDELRPVEKVNAGKTRDIVSPPLDHTAAMKKLIGRCAGFCRTHAGPVFGHAIGLDKPTWFKIIRNHLMAFGDGNMFDFDYGKFDSTVPGCFTEFLDQFFDLYYEGSTEEEKKARRVLTHELRFTELLIGQNIACTIKGNKSGNWLTDFYNSLANVWILMVAFHRLMKTQCFMEATPLMWTQYVRVFTLGDDVVGAISPQIQSWYNPASIAGVLTDTGFNVTAADKSELTTEFKSIDEVTFLKSQFRIQGNVVVPTMPKYVSYKEMNWVKKDCDDNVSGRICRVIDACKFMAWHDESDYDEFVKHVHEVIPRDEAMCLVGVDIPSFRAERMDIWRKQAMAEMSHCIAKYDWAELSYRAHMGREVQCNLNFS